MGTEIAKEKFSERDYARFTERLERCLADLGQLLGRPGFGAGPATVGAELELFLVDGAARPLPLNQAVRALGRRPPRRRRAQPLQPGAELLARAAGRPPVHRAGR